MTSPQVFKGVPGAKPDGCPVSELDLVPKLKGAQLRGRFGLARGAYFLQGAAALKTRLQSAGDKTLNL